MRASKPGVQMGPWRGSRLASSLQTLCLKAQGHPERHRAASRALKAISKVRGGGSRPSSSSTDGETEARGRGLPWDGAEGGRPGGGGAGLLGGSSPAALGAARSW